MTLTLEQQQAAYTPTSVAVTAGAGTGKTHMLSERYLFHVKEQGLTPLEIVAVTFTEKAAAELRARIRKTFRENLSERSDVMAELEAAQISTFHGLCARICKEHPDAAGVSPDFRVLDDLEGPIWFSEQLQRGLATLPAHIYQTIPYTLMRTILKPLLQDPIAARKALDKDQESWPSLVHLEKTLAREELINNEIWHEAYRVLQSYSGQPDDLCEGNRRIALQAMQAIRDGEDAKPWLESISQIKLNGGSGKKWPNGGLVEVKDSLKNLREHVQSAIKEGLITLELGTLDTDFATMLPALKEAFYTVDNVWRQAKLENRILDYADLEVYALKALESQDVRDYYAQRWKAFLIDEFQDTNPVQSELIEKLSENVILTIVGDEKQSIYSFRQADVDCFQAFRQRITNDGGEEVSISLSFRTHQSLVSSFNSTFQELLGDLFQKLDAHREEPPDVGPHLRAYVIEKEKNTSRMERQQAEAKLIASLVREMLDQPIQVHDKATGTLRAIRPGDIGIISKTWAPLGVYGEILQSFGIPAIQSGGANLMDTREAKDGWAFIRFMADPQDDLALAALLRSPFFAKSDRELLSLAQAVPKEQSWWQSLHQLPAFQHLQDLLTRLLDSREEELPSRLLQQADRLVGYSAVIANLPNPSRREADWQGFLELIRMLESTTGDVFSVARRLKHLVENEINIPRPLLEPENAVALMTIHASKGLEWPVVLIPDLTRKPPPDRHSMRYDSTLGLGIKLNIDGEDELQKPAMYRILEARQKRGQQDELKRLLYVALTRARDQVILTAPEETGEALSVLSNGLLAAGIPMQTFSIQAVEHRTCNLQNATQNIASAELLTGTVSSGLTELPVTALSDYALCPKRFYFKYVEGHPGIMELWGESAYGDRIGLLTHKALEIGIRDVNTLARFDMELPKSYVKEALQLALDFDTTPVFMPFRESFVSREMPVELDVGSNGHSLRLKGVIDLLGDDFVLDYKTEREMNPQHHRFQLWAYAVATQRTTAHIAYLRHKQLHTFSTKTLSQIDEESKAIVHAIQKSDFQANSNPQHCAICPYQTICEEKYIET